MAWIIPFENTGTNVELGTTDNLYIDEGILFAASARGTGSNQKIIVEGRAVTGDQNVFSLGTTGTTDNFIHVTRTGKVTSLGADSGNLAAFGMLGKSGQIINEGTVTATTNNGSGPAMIGADPDFSFSIVNSGMITAATFGVTSAAIGDFGGTFTLTNSGTITGGEGESTFAGVTGTVRWGSFTSFGQIDTTIVDPNIKETIVNTGSMFGDINLGAGDDLYDGSLGRVVSDVFGGEGSDRLYTGLGDDRLYGGNGNDYLQGGKGADYLNGGSGFDTAQYATAGSGVVASLANAALNTGDAAGDTYVSIEHLSGSAYNDALFGTTGNNTFNGRNGDDKLQGNAGNDSLTGGSGKDIFVFTTALNAATNVDTITDFVVADDTIQLENAFFTALTTPGTLAEAAFQANNSGLASDATDRIIYENDTGNLYYDSNGNAAGGSTLIAHLSAGLALTYLDFVVI